VKTLTLCREPKAKQMAKRNTKKEKRRFQGVSSGCCGTSSRSRKTIELTMAKNKRAKICDVRIHTAVPMWLYDDYRILAEVGLDGRTISEVIRHVMITYKANNQEKFKHARDLMLRREGGLNMRKLFGGNREAGT
jgi:hypothetical protein